MISLLGTVIALTLVVYEGSLALSQLLTNIVIAAIENGLLTDDFLLPGGDFSYPWEFTRKIWLFHIYELA